jgi:hypothetical protein
MLGPPSLNIFARLIKMSRREPASVPAKKKGPVAGPLRYTLFTLLSV